MRITITIPLEVLQTVADATDVTDGSRALFQFKQQRLEIHLTSNAKICSMDLILPIDRTLDLNTPLSIGVDVAPFTKFTRIFADMGIETTIRSSEGKISFSQNNISLRFQLNDIGKIPQAGSHHNCDRSEKIVLSGSRLNKVIKLAGQLSERISFTVHPNESSFCVQASGDTDYVEMWTNHSSITTSNGTESEPIKTDLIAKYIKPLQATIPNSAEVMYKVTYDSSLRVTYTLPQTNAMVSYCIPRILKR